MSTKEFHKAMDAINASEAGGIRADLVSQPCSDYLVVVGNCQTCQSPIYGNSTIKQGQVPVVQRTCFCPVPNIVGQRRTT